MPWHPAGDDEVRVGAHPPVYVRADIGDDGLRAPFGEGTASSTNPCPQAPADHGNNALEMPSYRRLPRRRNLRREGRASVRAGLGLFRGRLLRHQSRKARREVGYCGQFGQALHDGLLRFVWHKG